LKYFVNVKYFEGKICIEENITKFKVYYIFEKKQRKERK